MRLWHVPIQHYLRSDTVHSSYSTLRSAVRGIKHESRGPIQHGAKLSAVLRARDHGLRVLYSAGTARTKHALWAGASGTAPSLPLRLPFDYGTTCQCTHIGHRHLVMDKQSSLVTQVKKKE